LIFVKVWVEALTGKQALLFHYIAKNLEDEGHEVIFTTRRYDYTESNLDRLGRKYISVGEYGGASLKDKLISGSERIIQLARTMDHEKPDVLICFPSPDAHRTAFGLGIPIIQLNDTPHAEAVARLTISLTKFVVYPESIDQSLFSRYGKSEFIAYHGVDELLWTRDFIPQVGVLDKLELSEDTYLVMRCEESKAAYFQKMYPHNSPGKTVLGNLIQYVKQAHPGLEIVAFPRYPEQEEQLREMGVIIPDHSVDTLSLVAYAHLVITGGGTMGREAALLGTPSIYYFPKELAVSRFLADQGFPIYHLPHFLDQPQLINDLLEYPRMEEEKRRQLLGDMETPYTGVERALSRIFADGLL
jgi:predicted glycosyltransferase